MDKLDKRYLLKHFLISVLLVNGYILFTKSGYSFLSLSNSLAIFGLAYFIIGMFRYVIKSGFFDLPAYGFKKVVEVIRTHNYSTRESELGSYMDYLTSKEYDKEIIELTLLGLTLILLSILMTLFAKI